MPNAKMIQNSVIAGLARIFCVPRNPAVMVRSRQPTLTQAAAPTKLADRLTSSTSALCRNGERAVLAGSVLRTKATIANEATRAAAAPEAYIPNGIGRL